MANWSTYLANKMIGHLFGVSTYTPGTLYLALFTTNPTMPAGTGAVETTYTGYARISLASSFGTPASGSTSNTTALSFGQCTAGTATIVGYGVYDASSGGNLLLAGTCSLAVSSGEIPQFAVSALTESIS